MKIPQVGLVVINKPAGMTSHDVVDQIRKITGVQKVGHAGTLDPFATGVLVIMIGREATKKSAKLTKSDKEYLATVEFGRTTDTLDPTGKFIGQAKLKPVSQSKLQQVLRGFVGRQLQEVPLYSAVKIQGEKLYQKARKGKFVPLPKKEVVIYEIELKKLSKTKGKISQAQIRVVCSSGTYIRSLARDIGNRLGLPAYLVKLRRTRQGRFKLDQSISLTLSEKIDKIG